MCVLLDDNITVGVLSSLRYSPLFFSHKHQLLILICWLVEHLEHAVHLKVYQRHCSFLLVAHFCGMAHIPYHDNDACCALPCCVASHLPMHLKSWNQWLGVPQGLADYLMLL